MPCTRPTKQFIRFITPENRIFHWSPQRDRFAASSIAITPLSLISRSLTSGWHRCRRSFNFSLANASRSLGSRNTKRVESLKRLEKSITSKSTNSYQRQIHDRTRCLKSRLLRYAVSSSHRIGAVDEFVPGHSVSVTPLPVSLSQRD